MNDDEAFLRAVIASPEDETLRLVYADWLEERGDPRAEFLRVHWDVPRLSFFDRVAGEGGLDNHLRSFPDLRDSEGAREANRWRRDRREALTPEGFRDWVAVIDTLGYPFRPISFWSDEDGELPFRERIGTRGGVVTFESAFRGETAWEPGLHEDLAFLCGLPPGNCAYGAGDCPIHPFLCEFAGSDRPPTGADILRSLHASDFQSQHIPSLDVPAIAYPGYHPHTDNDEIHNDSDQQHLFPYLEDILEARDRARNAVAARHAVHDTLRSAVIDGHLWYVLLHSRSGLPADHGDRGSWVVLFAVGRSRRGDRLVGVVSHQMCHNLCD